MRHSRRVFANSFWSVAQVAVSGALYLILYRFLYRTVGLDQLGVWSLVMAWTSINNVASFGLGGGTTYFIPKHLARGERAYVTDLVQTAALTTAGAIGAGLVLFYPLVRLVLGAVIPDEGLFALALSILPHAFASVWLGATAGVVYASLDGFQRVDLRNAVLVLGAVVFLGAALVLVPRHGLVGLAEAQLLQAAVVLVASWALVRHLMPELPWLPWRWSREAFREMIGYSVRFQALTFSQMLFEPVTKSLLAVFGGVSATGLFEMANRLVVQLRAFVVAAYSALIPTLTDIGETRPELLRGIYETSCRYMAALLALSLPLLVAFAPLVSRLWLGEYEPAFILFMILLAVGWFANLAITPAYVSYLGAGDLRWVLRSHVVIAVLNVALGAVLGAMLGGAGVVLGFVVALVAGSWLVPLAYAREHEGSGRHLWTSPATLRLAACALLGMTGVLVLVAVGRATIAPEVLTAAALAVYATATAWPAWQHPARRELSEWVQRAVGASRPHQV